MGSALLVAVLLGAAHAATGADTAAVVPTGDTGVVDPSTSDTGAGDTGAASADSGSPEAQDTSSPYGSSAAVLAGEVGGCHCAAAGATASWVVGTLAAVAVCARRFS